MNSYLAELITVRDCKAIGADLDLGFHTADVKTYGIDLVRAITEYAMIDLHRHDVMALMSCAPHQRLATTRKNSHTFLIFVGHTDSKFNGIYK